MTEVIFGIVGAVVGVGGLVFGAITASRNKKLDDASEGKQGGIMLTEIGYIKAGIDDVKKDTREFRAEMQNLHDRIVRSEESCKRAHYRIDKLEKYHQPN